MRKYLNQSGVFGIFWDVYAPTNVCVKDTQGRLWYFKTTKMLHPRGLNVWQRLNVSCVSPKLLRTLPHIVENLGITMVVHLISRV